MLDCSLDEITLNGSTNISNPEISWMGPDPSMDATILNPTISEAGTYELTVIDPENNCLTTDEILSLIHI